MNTVKKTDYSKNVLKQFLWRFFQKLGSRLSCRRKKLNKELFEPDNDEDVTIKIPRGARGSKATHLLSPAYKTEGEIRANKHSLLSLFCEN